MDGEVPPYWSSTTLHVRGRALEPEQRQNRSRLLALLATLLLVSIIGVAVHEAGPHGAQNRVVSDSDCHLKHCEGERGVSGQPITRTEVAGRAHQWLNHSQIRYSSVGGHYGPGGWGWYRRDCSGFVSMALHLPDAHGGATTVELAHDVTAISPRRLRPYDLIGRLGPGSGGENGHVQLFLGWVGHHHARVRVAEQGGLKVQARWPHEATYRWPEKMSDGVVLGTYRYVHMATG